MPGEVVGEHAEEHVRADAGLEVVVDRADLKLRAFEGPERPLDLSRPLYERTTSPLSSSLLATLVRSA